MKQISCAAVTGYLKRNKWLILFLFYQIALWYIFMVNAWGEDTHKRVVSNCAYFFIMCGLCSLMHGWLRKAFLTLFFLISIVPNMIVLGWFDMNVSIIKSTDFWVIFDTNPNETSGFLDTVSIGTAIKVCAFFIGSVWLFILALREDKQKPNYMLSIGAGVVWLGVSLSLPFRAHCPEIDFYKSFMNYKKEQREVAEFYANRKNLQLDATYYLPAEKKTFVIAIGESATRNHYSCYGYARKTTPKLDSLAQIDNFVFFDNVVSPDIQTLVCMKQILTFTNYEFPNMYKQEASIVEILKSAGYKVYWIDNQGVGGIDTYTPTSYRCIADLSDYCYVSRENKLDESILPQIDSCLNDTAANKVIFVHLRGSHFPYHIQYSTNYKVFIDNNVVSPFAHELTPKEIETINDYDNSIAYNDFVLSSILQSLREQAGMNAFLYLSDHGEEVFDTQKYAGRSFERLTPGLCEIPFILWRNEAYLSVTDLHINPSCPYCSDDVIHSLMDLTGVNYALKDTCRSIFRQGFKEKERRIRTQIYDNLKVTTTEPLER